MGDPGGQQQSRLGGVRSATRPPQTGRGCQTSRLASGCVLDRTTRTRPHERTEHVATSAADWARPFDVRAAGLPLWEARPMAVLQPMPPINLPVAQLAQFGAQWAANGDALSRTPPFSSSQLGGLVDSRVGAALAEMLGNIPVVVPVATSLTPAQADCVEVGPVRVVGGVRPQNFDVGYRPDGVRFAFDSKTLNDRKSVGKNYQNMINDLATEATTVHTRFPSAVVGFMVVIPGPCLPAVGGVGRALIGTLERLGGRVLVDEPLHRAEALSLVIWDPATGNVDPQVPDPASALRIERFSAQVEAAYHQRFQGLPPHAE